MATALRLVGMVALVLLPVLAPSVPAQQESYVWINVNQQVIEPGGDVVATVHANAAGTLALYRVDPVAFSANGTEAPAVETVGSQPFSTSHDHGSQTLTFANVPRGLYVLRASVPGREVDHVVQVTTLGFLAKHGETKAVVWAFDLRALEPVRDAAVYVDGRRVATTNADGLATVTESGPIVLQAAGQVAVMAEDWMMHREPGRVAIYTDRPLYRPGQTVHIKLVAWERDGNAFGPGARDDVTVRVTRWGGEREELLLNRAVTPNAYGAASLDLALPDSAGLGHYSITVNAGESSSYGSFEVEEYRLPKFRVGVTPNEARLAVGDALDLLITAEYYYGEPLTQGAVEYEITGSPWSWNPCAWCLHGDSYYPYYEESTYRDEGTLELGDDGSARLRVAPDSAGTYRVVARVTAPNGERIEASALMFVLPAALDLRVEGPWHVEAGENGTLRVEMKDLMGRPEDGSASVALVRRNWTYQGHEYQEQVDTLWTRTVEVKGGRASVPFTIPEHGSYEFRVTAADAKGRETTVTHWLWSSDDAYGWDVQGDIEIVPERTSFRLGERMVFHAAAREAGPILVTMEAGDVHDAKVLRNAGSVTFTSRGEHTPQAYAVATKLERQQGFLPHVVSDRVTVDVAPNAHALLLEVISDRETYSDGDTARILVRVTDVQGRPVRAEVSLAMVDEALLALRPHQAPSILDVFYPPRYLAYERMSWGYSYWGSRTVAAPATPPTTPPAEGEALADADDSLAFAASGKPPANIKIREFFPETALWLPHVETDALGLARIEAKLPDSLTTWRIVTQAVSKDGLAGHNETNLVTKRNMVADLFTPRFFTQGDESTVQATLSNYVGALRDVQVLLEAEGIELVGPASRTLTLSHGQSDLVSFAVRAAVPGHATFTLYAWTGDVPAAGDAMRVRIPILVHGSPVREAEAGTNAATVTLRIPASAVPGQSTINVTLAPTLADALVDALPFLTGYPYGCVEQTMSRFLPTLAVAAVAEEFGLEKSAIDPEMDDQVDAGLTRLYNFQHASGAWGWWESDADNPYTTAYVVYGLAVARDAGYDIDEDALRRGVDALAKMATSERAANMKAYALYALSVADPSKVKEVPDGSTAASLAMAALVADAMGRESTARAKLEALRDKAATENGRTHWSDDLADWSDHGVSTDTMLTAIALRAFSRLEPNAPEAAGAVRWLLDQRRGASWYTTKDTAETVLSLAEHFRETGELDADFTATVVVDGRAFTREFTPDTLFQARRAIEVPVEAGAHTIEFRKDGPGTLYWSAAAAYFETSEPIEARAETFRLRREIVDEDGREVARLHVGQEATVRLTVTSLGADRRYVLVEDPLPAGVEVVPGEQAYRPWYWHGDVWCDWCGHWSAAEVRDEKVSFSAWWLGRGEARTFEYRIRAVFPGEYHVMPTRAEEMYDPDLQGNGAESRLVIEPAPGLQFGRVELTAKELRARVLPVGDVPGALDARVVDANGNETSRGRFARTEDGDWVVRLAIPATGDFRLVLEAGDAAAKKFVRRTPEAIETVRRFSETVESLWEGDGDENVLKVVSKLAPVGDAPNYAAVFAGLPLEEIGPVSRRLRESDDVIPTGGILLGYFAVLAVAMAVGLRRRKG